MSLSHLMCLNFFIADVQDGLGPYLGVFLKQKGFISVTLGEQILRAETVPLFVLSAINYEYLE